MGDRWEADWGINQGSLGVNLQVTQYINEKGEKEKRGARIF